MDSTPGQFTEGVWPFLLACRRAPADFAGLLCRRALEIAGAAAAAVFMHSGAERVCAAAAGRSSLNGHLAPLVRAAFETGKASFQGPARLPLFEGHGPAAAVACVPFVTMGGGRTYVMVVEGNPGLGSFPEISQSQLLDLALLATIAAPPLSPGVAALSIPAAHDPEGRRVRHGLRFPFPGIVGESPPLVAAFRRLEVALRNSRHVLLLGESGVGKELFARTFIEEGVSKGREFVHVVVPNVTSTLLESELFGHEMGAFTGATRDKVGLLGGGRKILLFLDEIGNIPPEVQSKLLQLCETGIFRPVGSSKEIRADVRIVAATSRDLADLMRRGEFLEDLYFRLARNVIRIPALRHRLDDVPRLLNHFFGQESLRFGTDAHSFIAAYGWPGNLRELRDVLEFLLEARDGEILGDHIRAEVSYRPAIQGSELDESPVGLAHLKELSDNEKRKLISAELGRNGGDLEAIRKAAGYSREGWVRLLIRLKLRSPRNARGADLG